MTASKAFLDANLLIEIILARKQAKLARELIEKHRGQLYISALTAHLVVHFGQRIVDLPMLREFLADYNVLALEDADFEWAFMNVRGRDFEDALQLAVAIRNGCDTFFTLDSSLAATYKKLPAIKVALVK